MSALIEMSIAQRHIYYDSFFIQCHSSKGKWWKCKCKIFFVQTFISVWSQAPTERQLRYKEKVTELRRKRNSSLNKEQKEKHMVSGWELSLIYLAPKKQKNSPFDALKVFRLSFIPSIARITARATEQAGSRCWRTSPATTTSSCSGKRRHVPRTTL